MNDKILERFNSEMNDEPKTPEEILDNNIKEWFEKSLFHYTHWARSRFLKSAAESVVLKAMEEYATQQIGEFISNQSAITTIYNVPKHILEEHAEIKSKEIKEALAYTLKMINNSIYNVAWQNEIDWTKIEEFKKLIAQTQQP